MPDTMSFVKRTAVTFFQKPMFLSHVADWSSHHTKDGDEKSLSTQSRLSLSVWCMTRLNHLDTNQLITISNFSSSRVFSVKVLLS